MVTESKNDHGRMLTSRQYMGPTVKIHLSLAGSVTQNLHYCGGQGFLGAVASKCDGKKAIHSEEL